MGWMNSMSYIRLDFSHMSYTRQKISSFMITTWISVFVIRKEKLHSENHASQKLAPYSVLRNDVFADAVQQSTPSAGNGERTHPSIANRDRARLRPRMGHDARLFAAPTT
ncbi:MAG: hypothetical protein QM777_16480 [Pseudorhodoferax sp.]